MELNAPPIEPFAGERKPAPALVPPTHAPGITGDERGRPRGTALLMAFGVSVVSRAQSACEPGARLMIAEIWFCLDARSAGLPATSLIS